MNKTYLVTYRVTIPVTVDLDEGEDPSPKMNASLRYKVERKAHYELPSRSVDIDYTRCVRIAEAKSKNKKENGHEIIH